MRLWNSQVLLRQEKWLITNLNRPIFLDHHMDITRLPTNWSLILVKMTPRLKLIENNIITAEQLFLIFLKTLMLGALNKARGLCSTHQCLLRRWFSYHLKTSWNKSPISFTSLETPVKSLKLSRVSNRLCNEKLTMWSRHMERLLTKTS